MVSTVVSHPSGFSWLSRALDVQRGTLLKSCCRGNYTHVKELVVERKEEGADGGFGRQACEGFGQPRGMYKSHLPFA